MKSVFTNINHICRMPLRRPALWVVITAFLFSCTSLAPVDYSEFDNFGSEGIPGDWSGLFTPLPGDSADIGRVNYDVVIIVRYNARCTSRNIVLDIEEMSLAADTPDSLRVDLSLFHNGGMPAGTGNLGLYELTDTLHKAFRIPPQYTLSVSTPFSPEETRGINAIGVKLVRTDCAFPLSVKNILP